MSLWTKHVKVNCGPPHPLILQLQIMASRKSAPPAHSYILLKDKGVGCLRGKLVELKQDGRYSAHSHWLLLHHISISLRSAEVAPLSKNECHILDAIPYDDVRYTVYSTPGKLAWGVGLKVGDTVLARLPPKSLFGGGVEQDLYTAAIIRWYGNVMKHGQCYQFGVEITVSVQCPCPQVYAGKGHIRRCS